jgi:hypothetical protein
MEPDLIPASEMKTIFPGTTDQYWATLRHKGTGPEYVKLIRKIFYGRGQIDAWIDGNRYARTDQPIREAV